MNNKRAKQIRKSVKNYVESSDQDISSEVAYTGQAPVFNVLSQDGQLPQVQKIQAGKPFKMKPCERTLYKGLKKAYKKGMSKTDKPVF